MGSTVTRLDSDSLETTGISSPSAPQNRHDLESWSLDLWIFGSTLASCIILDSIRFSSRMTPAMTRLVILYGMGGLSDVGRHAVQVAVEKRLKGEVEGIIKVLTPYPELLDEPNWNCGCTEEHKFTEEEKKLFDLVHVKDWSDKSLISHFKDATAVISCVGNRQPTFMGVKPDSWCSLEGNQLVISAMKEHSIQRAVVCSSMGINEDWPPAEFHWAGKAMSLIFTVFARKAYRDLADMENAYRASDLDYLLVRPVGIGEDFVPENEWHLQTEKHKDTDLHMEIAKLDVARYMVQEVLAPTRHKDAVVIGGIKKDRPKPEKK
ncbi:Demethylmenaquinone methyltransferase [Seminavis robusta]|uniref:Demethylmenaquinone methyltransferase n=1 Tax=Seminavis robusta TaxID=568900 RepID=A0A9N8DK89_9STRA|nr:Demethylmenaquinone methyltransferase [Seminavis robusta]|eukprot:Sro200_g084780.1 Demethylmenaquinone methyltransferase (321) ;mRNA; f:56066-57103